MEEQEKTMQRKILVTGGTGGVGRFVVRSLLRHKLSVRVLTRNEANISAALAGCEDVDLDQIEVVTGNLKAKADVEKAVEGVSGIIIASGGGNPFGNSNHDVDFQGVSHLVECAKKGNVSPLILVSSAGITQTMMSITMNLFVGNYAKWKKRGEDLVRQSGLDYTVVRPTWLADEESDSESTAERVGVSQGDKISVMKTRVSRKDVAEVCVEALLHREATSKVTFELINKEQEKKAEEEQEEEGEKKTSKKKKKKSEKRTR